MKLQLESHSFPLPLWIIKTRLFSHILKIENNRYDLKVLYKSFKSVAKEFKGLTVLSVEEEGKVVFKITL